MNDKRAVRELRHSLTAYSWLRLVVLVAILVPILTPQARADEIFNYTGNPYSRNDDPALFGSNLTASVTLSCTNICTDGLYQRAQMTSLLLQSGTLSLDVNAPNVFIEFASVLLINDQITQWALSLYTPFMGGQRGDNINTGFGPPGSLIVDTAHSRAPGGAFVLNSPGVWSSPTTVVGVPGPEIGTGIVPLIACVVGSFFWSRRRVKPGHRA